MLRIGLDVGGTFTDIVIADESGVRGTHKILTSATDPISPMIDGMKAILKKSPPTRTILNRSYTAPHSSPMRSSSKRAPRPP